MHVRIHRYSGDDVDKEKIKSNKENQQIELLLSSQNALANCKRFAESKGYTVEVVANGEEYQLNAKKD